ncbi:hypothetical protein FACS189416_2930 [Bacteroidia bacterium]|nr:hypothetical protein FACS189416_2930 [Bacteroidia bacterium]
MVKDDTNEAATQARLGAYQFAMQYFHFCKTLIDTLGEEKAFPVVQQALFELAIDRSDKMRAKAVELGLDFADKNSGKVNDLPFAGWRAGFDKSKGEVFCPYAQVWLTYYEEYPWFKRFAPLYCDVIDITKIENFTRTTSQRKTKNLLWGDDNCESVNFESDKVKQGIFTYGTRKS